jgi:tetratricopeptide (TPR) repeat protein
MFELKTHTMSEATLKYCIHLSILGIFTFLGCFAETATNKISTRDYPLFKGLDTYEMKISTDNPEAQKYFNQGLLLYYGYNYPEAARSFRAAAKLDPKCGISNWGACLSLCDCIDNPGDKWHAEALQAFRAAININNPGTEKEQALIDALFGQFDELPEKNKDTLSMFGKNMKKLYQLYPDDPDITAIYANVSTKEIDLYEGIRDADPSGEAEEVIKALEDGMKKHPYHPGLNHFYIHAMEGAGTPAKALEAAIRLDGLVPGSGHLQHMPAHIYFYYGNYHEATEANQRGIDADDQMFKDGGIKHPEFAGFYLHNYYFLFDSLMMEGRSAEAIDASHKLLKRLKDGDLPSTPYLQDVFHSVPFLLLARTGKWDKLNSESAPPEKLIFANAMRAYALGQAAVRKRNALESDNQLKNIHRAIENYAKAKANKEPYSPPLAKLLQISALDLSGQIAAAAGNKKKEIENLNKAIAIEDTLDFHMLPWYMYTRLSLGAALLADGKYQEAEAAYKKELEKHPHSGWALFGLTQCYDKQKKNKEAADCKKEFDAAWKYADLKLTSTRF